MKKLIFLTLLFFIACSNHSSVTDYANTKARYIFSDKNGLFGLLDENGKEIVLPEYLYIDKIKDGLIPAFTTKKEFIFLDGNGRKIKDVKFRDIDRSYSEELLAVSDIQSGKWGFIDKKLNYVINPQFETANKFSGGKAEVKKDGSWGIVNKKGDFVADPELEFRRLADKLEKLISSFSNDKEISDSPHRIEITEDEDSKYESVRKSTCLKEKSISFKYEGKWGFLDENGKEVIPAEYDSVSAFYFGRTWVQKGVHYFVIDRSGKKIFEIDPDWKSLDELRYVEPACYEWKEEKILAEDYWLPRRRIEKMFGKADPNPVLLKMGADELLQKIIEHYAGIQDKESCYLVASKTKTSKGGFGIRSSVGSAVAEEMQKNDAEKFVEKFIEINRKSVAVSGLEKYSCEKDGIVSDRICYGENGSGDYDIESCLNKVSGHRIIKFSAPLYDPESDAVMVYKEEYCGPLCGTGWLLFFEMRDGELSMTGSLFMFIS